MSIIHGPLLVHWTCSRIFRPVNLPRGPLSDLKLSIFSFVLSFKELDSQSFRINTLCSSISTPTPPYARPQERQRNFLSCLPKVPFVSFRQAAGSCLGLPLGRKGNGTLTLLSKIPLQSFQSLFLSLSNFSSWSWCLTPVANGLSGKW